MSAAGILNGNFRNGDYAALANQIKTDALNSEIVHPRQVKLDIIREAMSAEKYAAWYERNSHLNLAKWEALIDVELALLIPNDNAVIHARLEALGADIEAAGAEVSGAMLEEQAELMNVLQRDGDEPRKMLPPVTIRTLKQLGEPGALYDALKPIKTQETK